jgi:hypothetical protein
MLEIALLAALVIPQGPAAPVVINEFSYDDNVTDDFEFVELYNASNSPVDLTGWSLVVLSRTQTGPTYTIQSGTVLQPGGFWVMGAATVPNVQQVIGTTNILPNGPHSAMELRAPAGVVIDRVDWVTHASTWAPTGIEGQGLPGAAIAAGEILVPGTPPEQRSSTMQRYSDGYDTGDNGYDFALLPATPGASNDLPSNLPYFDTFDTLPAGTTLTTWGRSFVAPTVVDPTLVGNGNPLAIPPSPQGGNAAVFYDPTGGGNATMLVTAPIQDVILECYAYFETAATTGGSTDGEAWTLGVRGSVDSFGYDPLIDPSYATATGLSPLLRPTGRTGIAWVLERTNTAQVLSLVDFGNGGTDRIVIQSIPIQTGVNDGWQRLKIRAIGDRIEAHFGGTFGRNDGIHISAKTDTVRPGGIAIGYREYLINNSDWRPPTLDQLVVVPGTGEVRMSGTGFPHTGGTPAIDVGSLPFPDNSDFTIVGTNLVPSAAAALLTGFVLLPTPFDLGLVGGPSGAHIYVDSVVTVPAPADPAGEWVFPLAVPNLPILTGARLEFQMLTLDVAMPQVLPIVNTPVVGVTFAN